MSKRKNLFASLNQDTLEQIAMSPARRKMTQSAPHSASSSFNIPDFIPDMIEEEEIAFRLFKIFHKNLENTSVQIDFPRLAKRIKIKDTEGKYVDIDTSSESMQSNGHADDQTSDHRNIAVIYTVLKTLIQFTQQGQQSFPSLEDFQSQYSPRNINELLNRYLGETHPVVQILKLCTQQIFAPAVVQIKKCIQHYAQYQDVKGGWSIDIDFSTQGKVIVSHHKQEVVFGKNSAGEHEDWYKFSWHFSIALDKQNTNNLISAEQVSSYELMQGPFSLHNFGLQFIKLEPISSTPREQMELTQKDLERLLHHVFQGVMMEFSAKCVRQCLQRMELAKLEAKQT